MNKLKNHKNLLARFYKIVSSYSHSSLTHIRKLIVAGLVPIIALSLSGCSPSQTTKGIDGNDITVFTKLSQLSDGDIWMQKVCQNIEGYEKGLVTSTDKNPDFKVPESDRKRYLLIAQVILKARDLTDYPQYELYRNGTVEEMANPGSNPADYSSLKLQCTAYHLMDLNLGKNYVPPVLVDAGCWSSDDPSNIGAKLQEKVAGKWKTVDSQKTLYQTAYCGGDYPLGAIFSVERSKSDPESRSLRIVWMPQNGVSLDGKTVEFATCPQKIRHGSIRSLEFSYESCQE
jgi:hypothetical protein